MPLNKDVLLRLKETILAEPNRVRMSVWSIRVPPEEQKVPGIHHFGDVSYYHDPEEHLLPKCNTVGCAAFWIVANEQGLGRALMYDVNTLRQRAIDFVGIHKVADLFYPSFWRRFTNNERLHEQYVNASTQEDRARAVARAIDEFIEYMEREDVHV